MDRCFGKDLLDINHWNLLSNRFTCVPRSSYYFDPRSRAYRGRRHSRTSASRCWNFNLEVIYIEFILLIPPTILFTTSWYGEFLEPRYHNVFTKKLDNVYVSRISHFHKNVEELYSSVYIENLVLIH